jgi:hypothetical protein
VTGAAAHIARTGRELEYLHQSLKLPHIYANHSTVPYPNEGLGLFPQLIGLPIGQKCSSFGPEKSGYYDGKSLVQTVFWCGSHGLDIGMRAVQLLYWQAFAQEKGLPVIS